MKETLADKSTTAPKRLKIDSWLVKRLRTLPRLALTAKAFYGSQKRGKKHGTYHYGNIVQKKPSHGD
jgi:hypothetical protein